MADATLGKGRDAIALARLVGETGRVVGIDAKEAAVHEAKRLAEIELTAREREALDLRHGDHAALLHYVPKGQAKLVAFNLGYMPGSDKSVRTKPETTLPALEQAIEALAPGGLLSVLCYLGHDGGREESERVEGYLSDLPSSSYTSSALLSLNRADPPRLLYTFKHAHGE